MMKYLLLLVVVGVALLLLFGRQRRPEDADSRRARSAKPGGAAPMLACAHCGVHTPRDECEIDGAGRAYCSAAHRLAGPR